MRQQTRIHGYRAGLVLWLCLAPVAGFATPVGPVSNIAVEQTGLGPETEGCRDFVVTPDQVREFLGKAVVISGRQNHDFFLHGPCFAQGTFDTRYGAWRWEMRNLGTGSITAANGDVFLLGDPDRESSLADE